MTTPARARYSGYRFSAEIISHAVWLYFRFLLGLRMVEELLAARGIIVSHETVRQWARKFGQQFANQIRRRAGLNVFWIRMSGVAEYQRSHLIEREPFYAGWQFRCFAGFRLIQKWIRHPGGNDPVTQAATERLLVSITVALRLERVDGLHRLRRDGSVGIHLVSCSEHAPAK